MHRFKTSTRVFAVAASVVALAASVLVVSASAQANHRTRAFHLTKNCDEYQFGVGSYCTVSTSNVAQIPTGARIFYAQAAANGALDSDIILYAGRGDTATGHCYVDFSTGNGACTLFGGTGSLDGFHARVDVSPLGGLDFAWDGTYRFGND